jgi:hypothetical protein
VLGSLERYNKETNSWELVAHFKTKRNRCSSCAFGSKIYVFGGSKGGAALHNDWDAYDVDTGEWLSDNDSSLTPAAAAAGNSSQSTFEGSKTAGAAAHDPVDIASGAKSQSDHCTAGALTGNSGEVIAVSALASSGHALATRQSDSGPATATRLLNRLKGLTLTVTVAMGCPTDSY